MNSSEHSEQGYNHQDNFIKNNLKKEDCDNQLSVDVYFNIYTCVQYFVCSLFET